MKTEKEIQEQIKQIEKDNKHLLTGGLATIQINAPRALLQLSVECKLETLYWILEKKWKNPLL